MRARHLSPRTERAYVGWIRRYIRYHGMRHPTELGEADIIAYLTHLAAERAGVAVDADAGVERARPVVPRGARDSDR
jgi:hypothetical protein